MRKLSRMTGTATQAATMRILVIVSWYARLIASRVALPMGQPVEASPMLE